MTKTVSTRVGQEMYRELENAARFVEMTIADILRGQIDAFLARVEELRETEKSPFSSIDD